MEGDFSNFQPREASRKASEDPDGEEIRAVGSWAFFLRK